SRGVEKERVLKLTRNTILKEKKEFREEFWRSNANFIKRKLAKIVMQKKILTSSTGTRRKETTVLHPSLFHFLQDVLHVNLM
ncbi:hypothetical protein P9433_24110, partial [Escherichia coli]|uniref:hypothetical protein n=1 Tax=Escherichia coli TaxID=562 RepID=UPI0038913E39